MIIELEDFLKLNIKDEVFIIETDTVYGMGCLYNSEAGAHKISNIKNRDNIKRYSLLVSDFKQVKDLTNNSEEYYDILNKYWPGAVTFIFDKSELVKDYISKDKTVGLRMPDNERTLKVIDRFGPLIMTSVNKSGDPAIVNFNDTLVFENEVDYIVRGKDLTNIPSTVYDLFNKKTIREGTIKL